MLDLQLQHPDQLFLGLQIFLDQIGRVMLQTRQAQFCQGLVLIFDLPDPSEENDASDIPAPFIRSQLPMIHDGHAHPVILTQAVQLVAFPGTGIIDPAIQVQETHQPPQG